MRFADAGRSEKQDVGLVAEILARRERLDLALVGIGLKPQSKSSSVLPGGSPEKLGIMVTRRSSLRSSCPVRSRSRKASGP
jgi:hypothetical protein